MMPEIAPRLRRILQEGAAIAIQRYFRGNRQFKRMMKWARQAQHRRIVRIQRVWRVQLKYVLLRRCAWGVHRTLLVLGVLK
jgi:hypothetical protein